MKAYLTKEADDQLHELLDYLETEFSLKISNAFLDQVIKIIETLELLPYGFPEVEKSPGIRKCVINKRTIAYYRIKEGLQEVEILSVESNWQNY